MRLKYKIECEPKICRVYGKDASDIIEKMYAIEDNLDFLIKTLKEQYPKDEIFEKNPNLSEYFFDTINCYLGDATDEFYVTSEGSKEHLYLEVTTAEIAESNDLDFLSDKTVEERKQYKLGDGEWSYYTKLGDTDYYFRFL